MPANQKYFVNLKRDDYDRVRQQLTSKRWSLPSGDSGYLRGPGGFIADWGYDETAKTLAMRIREPGDGQSYATVFGYIGSVVSLVSSKAQMQDSAT